MSRSLRKRDLTGLDACLFTQFHTSLIKKSSLTISLLHVVIL